MLCVNKYTTRPSVAVLSQPFKNLQCLYFLSNFVIAIVLEGVSLVYISLSLFSLTSHPVGIVVTSSSAGLPRVDIVRKYLIMSFR